MGKSRYIIDIISIKQFSKTTSRFIEQECYIAVRLLRATANKKNLFARGTFATPSSVCVSHDFVTFLPYRLPPGGWLVFFVVDFLTHLVADRSIEF